MLLFAVATLFCVSWIQDLVFNKEQPSCCNKGSDQAKPWDNPLAHARVPIFCIRQNYVVFAFFWCMSCNCLGQFSQNPPKANIAQQWSHMPMVCFMKIQTFGKHTKSYIPYAKDKRLDLYDHGQPWSRHSREDGKLIPWRRGCSHLQAAHQPKSKTAVFMTLTRPTTTAEKIANSFLGEGDARICKLLKICVRV